MQTHANAGVEAYETPRRERIKGAIKAKSECVRIPLTQTWTHKRSPNLTGEFQITFLCTFIDLILYLGYPDGTLYLENYFL